MTAAAVEPPKGEHLQGLILRGYTHRASCHLLFAFDGKKPAAKAFIGALLPSVQSAANWGPAKPETMLNIGLTFNGIATASDLSAEDLYKFPPTFKAGPASKASQDSLGDVGDSAVENWWSGAFKTEAIDCIVHAYALSTEKLGPFVAWIADAAKTAGVRELTRFEEYFFEDDRIHFGYRDGISKPALGWPEVWPPAGQYTDPGTLNNFVIGYGGSAFLPGPNLGNAGVFAKDGCYVAFRVMSQDVARFEKFLEDNETSEMPRGKLAAKLMGRWRNGSSLILSPDAPCRLTRDENAFGYQDDPGTKCPYSAHARVANPRDQSIKFKDAPVPLLIRRGMPYGAPEGSNDRGLIGLFLCGALAGQFERICGWVNRNDFSPVFKSPYPQDAVIGNRAQPDVKFLGMTLPQFITTRGTAYCLLPSMETLRKLG